MERPRSQRKRAREGQEGEDEPQPKAKQSAPSASIVQTSPICRLPRDMVNHIATFLSEPELRTLLLVSPFRRVLTRLPIPRTPAAIYAFAMALGQRGSIPLVQWFIERLRFPAWYSIAKGAAGANHLTLLRWLHGECSSIVPCDVGHEAWRCSCVIQEAARKGHVAIVDWALAIGDAPLNCHALAVKYGHLRVLQRLERVPQQGAPIRPKYAAQRGDLAMLRYLHKTHIPFDETCCASAAKAGQLDILKWLRAHGGQWDIAVYAKAAGAGHIHILDYALRNGCPKPPVAVACALAAKNDQLGTLQWLRAHNFRWTSTVLFIAALLGRTGIFKWAAANGCPTGGVPIVPASAIFGHLEIVQEALSRGFPGGTEVCFYASLLPAGAPVLRWAIEARLACNIATSIALACRGDRDLLDWVIAQGIPFSRNVDSSFDYLAGAGGDPIRKALDDIRAAHTHLEAHQLL